MTFKEQIEKDLRRLIKETKESGDSPCNTRCPFNDIYLMGDCTSCYELFPGWGDFYLAADMRVSPIESPLHYSACPCYALDAEFVSWRVHLFLEKGI